VHAVPGVVAIKNASLTPVNGETVDFGQDALACINDEEYFSFDAETGVEIKHVLPSGAVTATRTEGC